MATIAQMSVIQLAQPQLREAAQVLARAFHTDPMTRYMLPEEPGRDAAMATFFRSTLRVAFWRGQIYTTSGLDGLAVWLEPGKTSFPVHVVLRSGLIFLPLAFGNAAFLRFLTTVQGFERAQHQVISGRYWYLLHLGVEPGRQGQGIGSRLLGPGLAQADRDHVPCYLETLTEVNLPLYERHGFQVRSENRIQPDGPHFWTMTRDPQ